MNHILGSRSHVLCSALVSLAGALLTGCYADSGAEADDMAVEELVGEADSAIGEATCGTTAVSQHDNTSNLQCWDFISITSSTNTYGQSTCTDGYVIDMNGTYISGVRAQAAYVPADADTQNECAAIHSKMYRYSSSGALIESATLHGSWSNNTCFMVDGNNLQKAFGFSSGDRFVISTYYQFGPAISKLRTRLNVFAPTDC